MGWSLMLVFVVTNKLFVLFKGLKISLSCFTFNVYFVVKICPSDEQFDLWFAVRTFQIIWGKTYAQHVADGIIRRSQIL